MKSRIDLTGGRYGRLIVIRETEPAGYTRQWLCKCDCGNELIVRMPNLRSGHTTSCGCLQRERAGETNLDDLTGRRFGALSVIERVKCNKKSRHAFWRCRCDCGNMTVVDGVNLKMGTTKSCGCLRAKRGVELQEYVDNHLRVDGVVTPLLTSKKRSDNTTGVKGVSRVRRKSGRIVYQASIRVKGKTYHLGWHDTIEAAADARKAGEVKYHKPYLEGQQDE